MIEVNAYMAYDGTLFTSKAEAMIYEHNCRAKKSLKLFCENNFTYDEDSLSIFKILLEHASELKIMLGELEKTT
jgi:hypothetical protein